MFTGIISDIGTVREIERRGDTRIVFATSRDLDDVAIGASIACSGPCLTVIEKGERWFAVEASAETMSRTTLGSLMVSDRVNLERALKLGDELGGHIVSGHVDGVARILDTTPDGDSVRFEFEAPAALARFIAPKGSVALDGVSLTVNGVNGARFNVNVIRHTRECTTFGWRSAGDRVNIEIDTLARYVARMMQRDAE